MRWFVFILFARIQCEIVSQCAIHIVSVFGSNKEKYRTKKTKRELQQESGVDKFMFPFQVCTMWLCVCCAVHFFYVYESKTRN